MRSKLELRNTAVAGTAAAMALGLLGSTPAPERSEAVACPTVGWSHLETPPESTPATRQAQYFGEYLLGYLANTCKHSAGNRQIGVYRLGNGVVTLTLNHQVGSRVPGATDGAYHMSITTHEGQKGLWPSRITDFKVASLATTPEDGTRPTFVMNAHYVGTGWILNVEERTKPQGGGMVLGNTGASLSTEYTEQLLTAAAEVVAHESVGDPTDFSPVR